MSRLVLESPTRIDQGMDASIEAAQRRMALRSHDQCPVDLCASLLTTSLGESCGKCTPCRIGIARALELVTDILEGEGSDASFEELSQIAEHIACASDCAIGYEAGAALVRNLHDFHSDFISHITSGSCVQTRSQQVPCQKNCPAHVDIPGYIALIREGRYIDALRVLRNDNPLTATCGYVCEHPCELTCRRGIVDDAVNICALKRFADDQVVDYDPPACAPKTGKRIAVVGGGPAGLTASYYLQLMGHQVELIEQRPELGGMTRYGIPDYRLPPHTLDHDINFIKKTGVVVRTNTAIGKDISYDSLLKGFDAIYLAIGAHTDKKLGIAGEDAQGVMSAVEFLRRTNSHEDLHLEGKRVVVIGGGNVAMDCTRTARRLTHETVECVYRRRIQDMTALPEEIHEACAEGCQITPLEAPLSIETNADNQVTALITQPQMAGPIERGRPKPCALDVPPRRIACDLIIVAIGQDIDTSAFAHAISTNRGKIVADTSGKIAEGDALVFAGGDAVSGPATVIKAIAAGKLAAANIDEALGFKHDIYDRVDIPQAHPNTAAAGRAETQAVPLEASAYTFNLAMQGLHLSQAKHECSRCLRCDHYGFSAHYEGDDKAW